MNGDKRVKAGCSSERGGGAVGYLGAGPEITTKEGKWKAGGKGTSFIRRQYVG